MRIYPDFYLESVLEITPEFCKTNQIRGLILDIDNTLIDVDRKMLEGAIQWHNTIMESGVKTIIVSNTNKVDKVSKVANDLSIEYINFAKKPSKSGFLKAKEKLRIKGRRNCICWRSDFYRCYWSK